MLLFLVQNDQAGGTGGKHRRAGPYDHFRVAASDALPLVVPFPRPKAAVQHRHLFAESSAESVHCLWGQGYFRHQHYGGAALVQHFGDGLHVYLSLSAACNAVKEHSPLPPVHSCAYLFQYVSLRR